MPSKSDTIKSYLYLIDELQLKTFELKANENWLNKKISEIDQGEDSDIETIAKNNKIHAMLLNAKHFNETAMFSLDANTKTIKNHFKNYMEGK